MESEEESQSITGKNRMIASPLRALIDAAKIRLHDDAKENGWTAQARREIDEHRREEGREKYNDKRRFEYALKVRDETGEGPRVYMKGVTPQHRRVQVAGATAKWRSNLTPAQEAELKERKRLAAIDYRKRKKAEAAAAMEAARPDGFGKF